MTTEEKNKGGRPSKHADPKTIPVYMSGGEYKQVENVADSSHGGNKSAAALALIKKGLEHS